MLESERLTFRRYTMDDIDFYSSLLANPEIMRFIGKGITRTREEASELLTNLIDRYDEGEGLGLMVAINKKDGNYIGHIGLVRQVIEEKNKIELGYWIAKEYWGMGFATEAAVAFRDYGFRKLKVDSLISIIQHNNASSINVAKKVGMKLERSIVYHSKDVYIFQILSTDQSP